ncbi:MAG: hypothetical protein QOJ93_3308, partial [Actinomycetota bacterium]|nr:hypothetical protein [Actinomycetota bacterium]
MGTDTVNDTVLDAASPLPLDAHVSTESEDKLEAAADFEIPDLTGVAPGVEVTVLPEALLDAAYFDTPDLRLARNGITLRYRRDRSLGSTDEGTWTLKLPDEAPLKAPDKGEDAAGVGLVRQELTWAG